MNETRDTASPDAVRAIRWAGDALVLLDQRQLPGRIEYLHLATAGEVAGAIRDMVVRGAPAIGIAAAYGVVLAAARARRESPADWKSAMAGDLRLLMDSRPTAVNLGWAIRRMQAVLNCPGSGDPVADLLGEAERIHREDIEANREMGRLGAAYLSNSRAVITHCNTGSLATGGYGTALGVIRSAWAGGLIDRVYVSETRPWLQGSRLTAWELLQDGIPAVLMADSAAASLMHAGGVGWVIIGADRIAANGDVANKIGSYSHAVSARHHGLRLMVVAPVSTIDPDTPGGVDIEIERRGPGELVEFTGGRIAPMGVEVHNPVFDIVPAELVSVLVTERGAVEAPDAVKIRSLLGR